MSKTWLNQRRLEIWALQTYLDDTKLTEESRNFIRSENLKKLDDSKNLLRVHATIISILSEIVHDDLKNI